MKTKYAMNGGLAFSEKKDIRKLEKLASEGWLFTAFAWGGFCYKLKQGPKQELTYTMDFQSKPDAEYFEIFKTAGWSHVTSSANQIHVFCAPKGTAPIYSGNEIDEGKYKDIKSMSGKGAFYSLLALLVFSLSMKLSQSYFEFLMIPFYVLTLLSLVAFVFCFMPYVAYLYKETMNKTASSSDDNESLYSDNETENNKYIKMTSISAKVSWYSFNALILFGILWIVSKQYFVSLSYPLFIVSLVSLMAMLFFFTIYSVCQHKKNRNKV